MKLSEWIKKKLNEINQEHQLGGRDFFWMIQREEAKLHYSGRMRIWIESHYKNPLDREKGPVGPWRSEYLQKVKASAI